MGLALSTVPPRRRPSAPGGVRTPAPRSRAHRRGPETPTRPKPCYSTSRYLARSRRARRCLYAKRVQAASADRTLGAPTTCGSKRERRGGPLSGASLTTTASCSTHKEPQSPPGNGWEAPIQRRCSDARGCPSCRVNWGWRASFWRDVLRCDREPRIGSSVAGLPVAQVYAAWPSSSTYEGCASTRPAISSAVTQRNSSCSSRA